MIAWDTLDAEEQASWILVRSDSGTPFSSSTEELASIVTHEVPISGGGQIFVGKRVRLKQTITKPRVQLDVKKVAI